MSLSSVAKAITKGCIEALYVQHLLQHWIARMFEAKYLDVQTMWVQQLNKLGLISLNKLCTLENVADMMTKHVPRGVLDGSLTLW